MRVLIVFSAVFAFTNLTLPAESQEFSDKEIATTILLRAKAHHLAQANGIPLLCKVVFDPINIIKINEAKETYTIDFYTYITWQDERLKFTSTEFGVDRVNVSPMFVWGQDKQNDDLYWNPMIEFMNLEETKISEQSIRIEASGKCRYTIRQTATFKFAEGLDSFRRFPFDQQQLPICLESFRWDIKHVIFEIEEASQLTNDKEWQKTNLSEWRVIHAKESCTTKEYKGDPAPFSRATFLFTLKRLSGFYIWKTGLPLFLLTVIAMSVFWLPPKGELESRTVLSMTTLIAITTYSIVVNTELPKVSYLTVMDMWMLLSFILSGCGALENVLVLRASHGGDEAKAIKIDRFCRWIMPITYFIATILCLLSDKIKHHTLPS